ncbi:MAG: hypothetical protein AB7P23_05640 [Amphiplicatus sp.]
MKITLEPTPVLRKVDGVEHREWRGTDEEGVAVVALVRALAPQTHDEAVAARYRAALEDVGFARQAAIDLRQVLD